MSSVFDPMDASQKRAFARVYLEHLRRHDGEIDRAGRRLRRREAQLRVLGQSPVSLTSAPPVAQETFDRHQRSGSSPPVQDPRCLWALTAAKANLSERHAIEIQLAMSTTRRIDPDDPQSYVDLEELYHTRILSDVLATLGLTASFGPPPLATRLLIAVMIHLPRAIADVAILAAELGGVVLFQLLRQRAQALFSNEPKALARIEQLFAQIIADEIGHVLYVRSRLGRLRLLLARLALPLVAALYRRDVPEIDRLFGPTALLEGMEHADLATLRHIHPDPVAADALFCPLGLAAMPAASATEAPARCA